MTTQNGVNTSLSGQTGTGNFVGSTSPTITTPIIANYIYDTNGNIMANLNPAMSAVNFLVFQNNVTGGNPALYSAGTDTNITLQLSGKGTGGAIVQGTGTNNNAAPGFIGEYISSTVLSGSAVSVSNNTATDITSISLTAGDWDVEGLYFNNPAAGTTTSYIAGWVSASSATIPTPPANGITSSSSTLPASGTISLPTGTTRFSIASTTTIYLSTYITFAVSTMTAYGLIRARRIR